MGRGKVSAMVSAKQRSLLLWQQAAVEALCAADDDDARCS